MDWNKANKAIIEKKLSEALAKLARALDIRFEEWDMDEKLHNAVVREYIGCTPERSAVASVWAQRYDSWIQIAKALKIELGEQYLQFTNLTEINETYKYGIH
jgi:hypothetical protein